MHIYTRNLYIIYILKFILNFSLIEKHKNKNITNSYAYGSYYI